jgi:protein-S-isoprenylcysteine O-methyltransferase Ste14
MRLIAGGAAMHTVYYKLACDLWMLVAIVWAVGLFVAKPTVRTQSGGSRLFEIALSFLGFSLVFGRHFRNGWLGERFLPSSNLTGLVGLVLTFLGVAFSIWARLQLGGNWSGTVTVKQDHTLIRRGPYALVRHAIYSGFLLAILGVALIVGEYRGLLGLAVLFLAFLLKSSIEERFMLEQFDGDYRAYREQVRALIPFVF